MIIDITKKLLSLTLLLMLAVGMQAQSIVGNWKCTETQDGNKIDMYYDFGQTSLTIKLKMAYSDAEMGTVYMSVFLPGSYTRQGNKVDVSMRKKEAALTIDKIDFTSEANAVFSQQPALKEQMINEMKKTMESEKSDILKDLPGTAALTIEKLTDSKLDLTYSGETYSLTRIAQK